MVRSLGSQSASYEYSTLPVSGEKKKMGDFFSPCDFHYLLQMDPKSRLFCRGKETLRFKYGNQEIRELIFQHKAEGESVWTQSF